MHTTPPFLLLLLLLVTAAAALPGKPPSGGSNSQKTTSNTNDNNNKKGSSGRKKAEDTQPKYFHEAGYTMELGHYDARYFQGVVPYAEHRPALRRLIRSWLTTARELGVDTWIAHGTLLGWWWNGRVMPWDYDLDVQMPTTTLSFLGRHFNRTLHDYRFLVEGGEGEGGNGTADGGGGGEGGGGEPSYVNKTYLLDINPHHTDIGRGNGANIIDGRWIDVSNGLFVDITGLAERDPAASPGVWSCKNAHRYRTTELYPLRRAEFEGVPAGIPYAFDKILTDEYGAKSLVSTEWAGHHWMPELKEWVRMPEEEQKQAEAKLNNQQKQQDNGNAVVVVVEKTVVKGG